jgi:hypothetical protein
VFRARRCPRLTDGAVAALLRRGGRMTELCLNSNDNIKSQTALAIAECCAESLRVSAQGKESRG